MPVPEAWLTVGRVVGAQGLKGDVKINPSSDFPERFTRPGPRWLRSSREDEPLPIELIRGRQLPGRSVFVVHLKGIDDRSAAEALIGRDLLVPSDDRPTLEEGEFHLLDLIGLETRLHRDGPAIGTVTDLISAGNDLLEIKLSTGRHVLVPFVEAIVPEVVLNEGWLLLTPPPGLLDL
ncbi:MAG: ribosome maturation factor RimM [Cyanobium sp. NAT70]|nr:ribosome maturation factor RimM [Cyanobium sp. NAT70]|tara:strand:+ start:1391 stop:1924 length:534 start_codon:yes stop_codon:yes gene_type:complete